MQILRASEDYLEAMLMMQKEHGYVRSIDIAEKLGVTKPSVTYATKRLRENGYITMDKDGLITLTELGMAIAANMLVNYGAGCISVTKMSAIGNINTVISAFAGVVFLREPFTWVMLLGAVLVLTGVREVTKQGV